MPEEQFVQENWDARESRGAERKGQFCPGFLQPARATENQTWNGQGKKTKALAYRLLSAFRGIFFFI